ncbi:hypothetical protein STAFG_7372 [Streptomyces afghaniensis 772]|uniref:Uncharacterized protein n=1 Tax=Streptomyces afghaniensis 772 TaxID=1283301 RepID=S4MQ43_9ACTN|nr:hypothetical protein STAFG_7372 [Streptomyces afghaniensis 772]
MTRRPTVDPPLTEDHTASETLTLRVLEQHFSCAASALYER